MRQIAAMFRWHGSLRLRIFFSMMLLILVSFLLTGTITFYHFRKENEQYHLERLKRKEYAVNSAVDYFLRQEQRYRDPDSLVVLFDDKICELADIHNLDINIYSLQGRLLISSNPSLVDKHRVPEQLNSTLLDQVKTDGSPVILESGRADSTKYLSTFDFITDENGRPVALMNLPYFRGDKGHLDELRRFLQTLSEIYFLLFGGAVLIAYILSNYIAGSLGEIAGKLRNTRLTGKNEPLSWHTNDEIGTLVSEYNRMLEKLEESAVELARTERDQAWKDMARQVAHEIKNPLTPMRLQLQQLERKLGEAPPDRLRSITRSAIEQIDHLSEIAQAFSRFASLPELKPQSFDLFNLVASSVELFSEQGAFLDSQKVALPVIADRAQWNRVMTNLLRNAVQAVPENRQPKVRVSAWAEGQKAMIRICDNGSGIEASQAKKIFEPRFTTKSGGMGLGLAMVKRIIEQSKGNIYFESNLPVGTCFYLSLELQQNTEEGDSHESDN